jgi:hypothetical protein
MTLISNGWFRDVYRKHVLSPPTQINFRVCSRSI